MATEFTQQQRQLLLDNPEMVMFKPTDGLTPYLKRPIFIAFLPLLFFAVLVPVLVFTFKDFFVAHAVLSSVFLCTCMLLAVILVPVVFVAHDERRWKREHGDFYRIPLSRLLPEKITGKIVTITRVDFKSQQDEQYAFLTCEKDGEEIRYNYFAFVNRFELIPGQELLVVEGGEGFFAFVRRSTVTEGLYNVCK